MDWKKIANVVLTAAVSIMCATGFINTEESTTLATTGTAAIAGIGGFAIAIHDIITARKTKNQG